MRVLALAAVLGGCAFGADPIPRQGAPDASGQDAGSAPQIDASFLRDAGSAGSDAELPSGVDAGTPVSSDAGSDAGTDAGVDAGVACGTETCDGTDEDCDGVIDDGAMCPCPVVAFAAHAYLFCGASARTWAAARATCESVGYSLVVIENAPEDAFVYGELAARGFADTWVGLNDLVTETSWVWLNGVPVLYTHWDSGEPNDGGTSGEDCGVIMTRAGRESEWDDRDCASERPFVCEAPAP